MAFGGHLARRPTHDPKAAKRWVSTTVIVIGHTQTLSLIGLLKLGWPKSAEIVTNAIALDLVNLGGSKPEMGRKTASNCDLTRPPSSGESDSLSPRTTDNGTMVVSGGATMYGGDRMSLGPMI